MQNPTPQEILAGSQSEESAGVQPCYSPSDNQVAWLNPDAMPCTYQQAIITPAGYQFQCARPTTTIIRQSDPIGSIRLYHSGQTMYQQPMAPTPPGHMPLSPSTIYSPPPTNSLTTQLNPQYQNQQQQQAYQAYLPTNSQGIFQQSQQPLQQQQQQRYQQPTSYQQTRVNPNPSSQQASQQNCLYLNNFNVRPTTGVRGQLSNHIIGRQQYLITTPVGPPQPTPPPSARSTSRSGSNQRRTHNRRNVDSCLSALLTTTPSSNLRHEDQTRNTIPVDYIPKHPNFPNLDTSQQSDDGPTNQLQMFPSSCCSTASTFPVSQASTAIHPPPIVPTSESVDSQCSQCVTRAPGPILVSQPQPPTSITQTPPGPVSMQQMSIIHHGRPNNAVTHTQATVVQPPVSVSSTTRVSTVPPRTNVEIQAKPETANKACQFVSDAGPSKVAVNTREVECQTEETKKTYVDRACSPIVFPTAPPSLHVRRKITAKRKLPRNRTPSPPALDTANGQSSSDSEIDVIE